MSALSTYILLLADGFHIYSRLRISLGLYTALITGLFTARAWQHASHIALARAPLADASPSDGELGDYLIHFAAWPRLLEGAARARLVSRHRSGGGKRTQADAGRTESLTRGRRELRTTRRAADPTPCEKSERTARPALIT